MKSLIGYTPSSLPKTGEVYETNGKYQKIINVQEEKGKLIIYYKELTKEELNKLVKSSN